MEPANRTAGACSRRWFLTALTAAGASSALTAESPAKGRVFPSAMQMYADPATDFQVFRVTDPQVTSYLPASHGRAIAGHGDAIVYASDASGRFEAFHLDLKTGTSRQLTDAQALDRSSVTFLPGYRSFAYLDGDRFVEANVATLKARDVYRCPGGFTLNGGLSIANDGQFSAVVEKRDSHYRLRLIRMTTGAATTLVESDDILRDPMLRPRRASVLYRRGDEHWIANFDGRQTYRLKIADGTTLQSAWSPDGRTVFYLNQPQDAHKLHNLREYSPDSKDDKPIADTTQYVRFAPNADASVFVGASGSKASPYVLLLVRMVKRELTVAEHKASDPTMVSPIFAPGSQQIFFVSDRHGKPAIYAMKVDKMVEQTDTN